MMRQRRAPGVQDQGCADLCSQVLRVGSDSTQDFRGHLEQQAIDHGLVVIGDRADRCRQCEHQVVIVHRQEVGLTGFEPATRGVTLALRAMPIPAGVVGDLGMLAGLAVQYMPAQGRTAALFNG